MPRASSNIVLCHLVSGQSEEALGCLSVCDCDRHGCHLFHIDPGSESSLSEVSACYVFLTKHNHTVQLLA